MRLIVESDYRALSRVAALHVAERLRANPEARLVVPTGATPLGLYQELAALHAQGQCDASLAHLFQLDEYLGVGPEDPRAFAGWLRRTFLEPLKIPAGHMTWLRGEAADTQDACRAYDTSVRLAGGFDLVVLGLGLNGHLGFNEPPADPHSLTRVVHLSSATIASNRHYWQEDLPVPEYALTCGMEHILTARQQLLLVAGTNKSAILQQSLLGPISQDVPGSYLQTCRDLVVMADMAAWPGAIPTQWQ